MRRTAVLLILGVASLAAPLGALCSACCVPESSGAAVTAPTCCGDACGASFTDARSQDPAMSGAKTELNPPSGKMLLPPHAGGLFLESASLPAPISLAPTESPPVSTSVLRL